MKKCLLSLLLCVFILVPLCIGCGSEPTKLDTSNNSFVPEGTCGDSEECTVHQFAYHAIDGDWEKHIGQEKVDAYIEAYSGTGEEFNIVTFVKFCGITREQYIEVMGMTDELDEKLTRHHPDCPYTNREFVDAIFGDDAELSERIFSIHVFDGL